MNKKKRNLNKFKVTEISLVDTPAQEGADITITKRNKGESQMEKDLKKTETEVTEDESGETEEVSKMSEKEKMSSKDEKMSEKDKRMGRKKPMMKDADESEESVAKSDKEAKLEKRIAELEASRENDRIEKRYHNEFADCKFTKDVGVALIKAVETIEDAKLREEAETFLKNTPKLQRVAKGTSDNNVSLDSTDEFNKAIQKRMDDHKEDRNTAFLKVASENPELANSASLGY